MARKQRNKLTNNMKKSLGIIILCGLVIGCVNDNVSDLESYVQKTKAKKPGKIEPLPDVKTYDNHQLRAK